MVRRSLVVVAVIAALAVTAGPASMAGAQQYPPGGFFISLSATTVVPGQTIDVNGAVSPGASAVTFTFFSVAQSLGSVTPAADGTFDASVTIPTDAELGSHTLVANDNTGLEVSAAVTVVAAGAGEGAGAGAGAGTGTGAGDLPRTGDDTSIPLARIAAVLVAAGGAALYFGRRRRSAPDPADVNAGV